jgi:hypothetical protein
MTEKQGVCLSTVKPAVFKWLTGIDPVERASVTLTKAGKAPRRRSSGKHHVTAQLIDDDWISINEKLTKHRWSVSKLAEHFKVEWAEMRAFIDNHTPDTASHHPTLSRAYTTLPCRRWSADGAAREKGSVFVTCPGDRLSTGRPSRVPL